MELAEEMVIPVGSQRGTSMICSSPKRSRTSAAEVIPCRPRLGVIEEASMLPLNRHNGTGGEVGNSWWVAGGRRRGCGAHSGCHGLSDRLLGNLEYSPYRECTNPQDYGRDTGRQCLSATDHLHP